MRDQLFYRQSPWAVFVIIAAVLFVAALLGYVIGRWNRSWAVEGAQIGAVQASMLGLLALLLGFTFAAASSRYDTRRGFAVDEANSLGTTFLRAQMLPEPYRTNLSDTLRRYVDLRLEAASVIQDPAKLAALRGETEEMQQRMWGQAVSVARADPRSVVTGLFVTSLNESIDLYSSRAAAFQGRVPVTILWILVAIAVAAFVVTGYSFGLAGQGGMVVVGLMALIVAAVIVMIVDLDQPTVGPVRVSQQSMVDLKNSLPGFEQKGR